MIEKCSDCGYNHDKQIESCEKTTERVKILMAGIELTKSGYAGVMPNGNIVDRREFPEAVAIQENKLFGTPKPKDIK